jgi:hypothetical protein
MKKLLLILLLFFPVHGAWADELDLECTITISGKRIDAYLYFHLDFKKKEVRQPRKKGNLVGINLVVSDNFYEWKSEPNMVRRMRVEGSDNYPIGQFIRIDRNNGKLLRVTYMSDNTENITTDVCKEFGVPQF